MNKPQKRLLTNFILVLIITIGFVVFIVNIRSTVNSSEAIRSLEILGKEVLRYRKQYGSLPSESYTEIIRDKFRMARLGNIHYRAQWIDFGADANSTILAYVTKPFKRFFEKYYIVLWLDGRVEKHCKADFERILDKQQNKSELEWLRKNILQKTQIHQEPDLF